MARPLIYKIVNGMRICKFCLIEKPIELFRWVPSKKHYRADCKDCEKEHRVVYRTSSRAYYNKCGQNARRNGKDFSLTYEEFLTFLNLSCFYCGEPLDHPRIDRFNNSKGYELENCVPCCWVCNRAKNVLSGEEFLFLCKKISIRQH